MHHLSICTETGEVISSMKLFAYHELSDKAKCKARDDEWTSDDHCDLWHELEEVAKDRGLDYERYGYMGDYVRLRRDPGPRDPDEFVGPEVTWLDMEFGIAYEEHLPWLRKAYACLERIESGVDRLIDKKRAEWVRKYGWEPDFYISDTSHFIEAQDRYEEYLTRCLNEALQHANDAVEGEVEFRSTDEYLSVEFAERGALFTESGAITEYIEEDFR